MLQVKLLPIAALLAVASAACSPGAGVASSDAGSGGAAVADAGGSVGEVGGSTSGTQGWVGATPGGGAGNASEGGREAAAGQPGEVLSADGISPMLVTSPRKRTGGPMAAQRSEHRRGRREYRRQRSRPALGRVWRHLQRALRRCSRVAEPQRSAPGSPAAVRSRRPPLQLRSDPDWR